METIQSILESKTKTILLSFLILAPERSFTSRELSVRLGISSSQLSKDLKIFVAQNLSKVFNKHKQAYYLLNQKHRLVRELRPSLAKNQGHYADELFSAIRRLGDIRAAFLSGLFTGYPELPVDILLVGKINLTRLQKFLDVCRKLMGAEINYSVMSEDEFIQRRDTFDRFIKDIFDYRHVIVVDKISPRQKNTAGPANNRGFKVTHF